LRPPPKSKPWHCGSWLSASNTRRRRGAAERHVPSRVSPWPASRAKRVLAALLPMEWRIKRQSGSQRTLARDGWGDVVFAFHDDEEIGPAMLATIARPARRARRQVIQRRSIVGVAIRLPVISAVRASSVGSPHALSPPRVRRTAGRDPRRPPGRHDHTRGLSHPAPLLRDAPAGGWLRAASAPAVLRRAKHPGRAGTARSRGRQHDDDLHTRVEPWGPGCPMPRRPSVS
jgi:predicted RNA binding protein YcfA (HicA-like mRNA interferase family)